MKHEDSNALTRLSILVLHSKKEYFTLRLMQNTRSNKSKQEEILLQYIDIPYFRNNPTYIDRWRMYYQRYKDPQILLLMYYKQISTHFHWIYLELSTHFLKVLQPEIAHFILNEALKTKVYDEVRIREALVKIPKFERKYSRGDLLALLNQRNINALGQVWNSFEEEFIYELYLPQDSPNFELMKLRHYESKYGIAYDLPEGANTNNSMMEKPSAGFFTRAFANCISKEKECIISGDSSIKAIEHVDTCSQSNQKLAGKCLNAGDLNHATTQEANENRSNIQDNDSEMSCASEHDVDDEHLGNLSLTPKSPDGSVQIDIKAAATGNISSEDLLKRSVNEAAEECIQLSSGEDEFTGENLQTHPDGIVQNLSHHSIHENSHDGTSSPVDEHTTVPVECICTQKEEEDSNNCITLPEPAQSPAHGSITDVGRDSTRSPGDQSLLSSRIEQSELSLSSEKYLPGHSHFSRFSGISECRPNADREEKANSSQIEFSSSFVGTQETEIQNADFEAKAKKAKANEFSSFKNMFEPDFLQVTGDLAPDSEIVIDKYIYLVQGAEIGGFSLLRIARDSDITQTMIGKCYLLKEATYQNAKIAKDLFKYECCEKDGSHFVLYEHSRIAHLGSIISNSNPTICLFYLRKVVEKFLNLRENDLVCLSPEDFFVDQSFGVALNSFEFAPASEESIHKTESELQKLFKTTEIQISYEFLSLIDKKLDLGSSKKEILKHKTELLENF